MRNFPSLFFPFLLFTINVQLRYIYFIRPTLAFVRENNVAGKNLLSASLESCCSRNFNDTYKSVRDTLGVI